MCWWSAILLEHPQTRVHLQTLLIASMLLPARLRFVGFVFVVAFALLNLYVGVIFSQFTRIRLMSTVGSAFLSSDQQEWAELSKMVFK